jgi:hypothetical protein
MAKGTAAASKGAAAPAKAPLESGLGLMSAEDRAAIMGNVPADAGPIADPVEQPEEYEAFASSITTAAEITMAARILTLEQKVADLTRGFEAWADKMNQRLAENPRVAANAPVSVRPATPEEEAAYTRTNFALYQLGLDQFNGIQDWRDKGSTVMEPKEEKRAAE